MRSYCAADLRLCFRICKKPVFSQQGLFIRYQENIACVLIFELTKQVQEKIDKMCGFARHILQFPERV